MFLGLDFSTQSLTGLVIDADNGVTMWQDSVNFGSELPQYGCPNGFLPGGKGGEVHADPRMWLEALDLLLKRARGKFDFERVRAIACSGQQHGSVYLDDSFASRVAAMDPEQPLASQLAPALTRATAPIWMDTSTTRQCAEIAAKVGGNEEVCRRTGSVAIERFTGPQIRRFWQLDPEAYDRTKTIHLVSSFVGSVLAGKNIAIDYGDGAGMNLLNLDSLDWDQTMLDATAPELGEKLPITSKSDTVTGRLSRYFVSKYGFSELCMVVLSTGDNPSSLVGMGATQPGTYVISLGTSDTMFAAMPEALPDPHGYGHVYGNPAGGFMSLICFRNGSLAREKLRDELGLDWGDFDTAGLAKTPAGNEGRLMLPFFGPEITPRHNFTGPVRNFPAKSAAPIQVRALLEGQFLNMRLHSQWLGTRPALIRLTGGASRNHGIAAMVANVFQAPVERLADGNGAALGAALRAAAACGNELGELTEKFCQAVDGSRLEPDPATAPAYETALNAFRDLLDSQTGAQAGQE